MRRRLLRAAAGVAGLYVGTYLLALWQSHRAVAMIRAYGESIPRTIQRTREAMSLLDALELSPEEKLRLLPLYRDALEP